MILRIEKEATVEVLKALQHMQAHHKQLQDKRDNSLWRPVSIPCTLETALEKLTKGELDRIRKAYEIKSVSALKKRELAAALATAVPQRINEFMNTMDQTSYSFIKKMIHYAGVIPNGDVPITLVKAYIKYGIIFPGIRDNEKVLYMPVELMKRFNQIDGNELRNIVQRNTEWIMLVHGLLYYYGVMNNELLMNKVGEFTGLEVAGREFTQVLAFASDFYGQVQRSDDGYKDDRVFNSAEIVEEHRMRPTLSYYPFTKKQLLSAGSPDYVDKTLKMNRFMMFLRANYELDQLETNEIVMQLTNMMMSGVSPALIMQYLESWFAIDSVEFMQQLLDQVVDLYHHTRQWALKGYTPHEVSQEKRSASQPQPAHPLSLEYANVKSNVVELPKRDKVGRNDPCPCGSGKKHKKCCGS